MSTLDKSISWLEATALMQGTFEKHVQPILQRMDVLEAALSINNGISEVFRTQSVFHPANCPLCDGSLVIITASPYTVSPCANLRCGLTEEEVKQEMGKLLLARREQIAAAQQKEKETTVSNTGKAQETLESVRQELGIKETKDDEWDGVRRIIL